MYGRRSIEIVDKSRMLSSRLWSPNYLHLIRPIPLTTLSILKFYNHFRTTILQTKHTRLCNHSTIIYAIPNQGAKMSLQVNTRER